MNSYFCKPVSDSERKSYIEMEMQTKSKKLKKKSKTKRGKENQGSQNRVGNYWVVYDIDKNYIRATPLNMVWRGADRDLLYERNDFKLRIPEEQLRMPLTNIENQIQLEESQNIENQSNEISIQESTIKFSNTKNWGKNKLKNLLIT